MFNIVIGSGVIHEHNIALFPLEKNGIIPCTVCKANNIRKYKRKMC